MKKRRVVRASAFATLLILCLFPGMARANNVSVDCNAGDSINAALATLTPTGPNQITVTGTCNENVSIADFRLLTIVAGVGGAKIVQPQDSNTFDIARSQNITLQNLEIAGVPGSTPGFGGGGVNIDEQSDVQILRCDIHDNEGGGVIAVNDSFLFLFGTNIHNNKPGDGLDVVRLSIADVRQTTIENNGCSGLVACFNFGIGGGVGVFVGNKSHVGLGGPQNNYNSEQWRHRNLGNGL